MAWRHPEEQRQWLEGPFPSLADPPVTVLTGSQFVHDLYVQMLPNDSEATEETRSESGAVTPTSVSVPDGGTVLIGGFTVLIGGLRTLQDARSEFGPAVTTSSLATNRLFKNTAYGRDAESLMLMVTPRIIIDEEEEERATGLRNGVAP